MKKGKSFNQVYHLDLETLIVLFEEKQKRNLSNKNSIVYTLAESFVYFVCLEVGFGVVKIVDILGVCVCSLKVLV